MGTFALQIAFMSVYINKFYYDYVNEEVIDYPMAGIIPILNYRIEF